MKASLKLLLSASLLTLPLAAVHAQGSDTSQTQGTSQADTNHNSSDAASAQTQNKTKDTPPTSLAERSEEHPNGSNGKAKQGTNTSERSGDATGRSDSTPATSATTQGSSSADSRTTPNAGDSKGGMTHGSHGTHSRSGDRSADDAAGNNDDGSQDEANTGSAKKNQ